MTVRQPPKLLPDLWKWTLASGLPINSRISARRSAGRPSRTARAQHRADARHQPADTYAAAASAYVQADGSRPGVTRRRAYHRFIGLWLGSKAPERNRNERAQEHSADRFTGSSSRGCSRSQQACYARRRLPST